MSRIFYFFCADAPCKVLYEITNCISLDKIGCGSAKSDRETFISCTFSCLNIARTSSVLSAIENVRFSFAFALTFHYLCKIKQLTDIINLKSVFALSDAEDIEDSRIKGRRTALFSRLYYDRTHFSCIHFRIYPRVWHHRLF